MRIIQNVLGCVLAGTLVAAPVAIATHPSQHHATPAAASHAVRPAQPAASRSHQRAPIDDAKLIARLKRKTELAHLRHERALAAAHARRVAAAREKRRLERIYSSSVAWAHQPRSIAVANCESGPGPNEPRYDRYVGKPHLRDPNGHYGKWQFAPSTADSVGAPGAGIADLPEAEQDYFAWKLWKRDGWGPWECANYV